MARDAVSVQNLLDFRHVVAGGTGPQGGSAPGRANRKGLGTEEERAALELLTGFPQRKIQR